MEGDKLLYSTAVLSNVTIIGNLYSLLISKRGKTEEKRRERNSGAGCFLGMHRERECGQIQFVPGSIQFSVFRGMIDDRSVDE